jgi:8-oxo-dGTP diphosphatase
VSLQYTICFCCYGELVLMLYRYRPPNQFQWNGLGGKLQEDETPQACVQREVLEEADIDLQMAHRLRFAGIVTWDLEAGSTSPSSGMYAFIADFQQASVTWEGDRVMPEGLLCWKPLQWVCDPGNTAVVSNIPHFLPCMLSQDIPFEYYCDYPNGLLPELVVRPLPPT